MTFVRLDETKRTPVFPAELCHSVYTPFSSNLGGSAHIVDIAQSNSTIRHSAQLNGDSASISSYYMLGFVTVQAISAHFHAIKT